MSYEPLHHKYRPQTFAHLVGQDAIATTLTNAIESQRIAPAYLLTGPRGTGKTSSARILAKSLNCLASTTPTATPCGVCEVCKGITNGSTLDVIEIDAASNTGVDNIRELIERSQFAPVQCRYKVYVIDECLTGESLVQTSEGLIRIDNSSLKGKKVLSYNDKTENWEYKKVLRWMDQGERPILVIKTKNYEIKCTGNHLLRTETGWIEAKNVKEGMKILSPVNVGVEPIFTNLEPMAESEDFPRGINFMEMPTAKNPITWQLSSNKLRKDTPVQKIKSLPIGSLQKGIVPLYNPIHKQSQINSTTILPWEQKRQENGWQTLNNIPSLQWNTSLEMVVSAQADGIAKVYDIEVEDNHNFVANGLLVHNCHMLSTAAFNALLKTLEEPPDRVIFVLATTDPQRVLPTIISRCQRFDFRRIPLDAMIKHLQYIAEKENINITLDAIAMVAQIAQGGLRDAESLLDQLSLLSGEVTVEKVWDLVGAVPERDLMSLLEAIASENTTAVLDCTRHLLNRGREPLIVLQNLAGFYRDLLIAKTAPDRSDLVALTQPTWEKLCQFVQEKNWSNTLILGGQKHLKESEVQIKNTTQPRLWLEVTLLGLLPAALERPVVQPTQVPVFSQPQQPQPKSIPVAVSSPPPPPKPAVNTQPEPEVKITPEPTPKPTISEPEIAAHSVEVPVVLDRNLEQIWQQVLECVQPNGTQSLFRQMGTLVQCNGNVAYIGLKSQPLLKIAQPKLPSLETAFYQVFGQRIKIQLQVGTKPQLNQTQSVVFSENKVETSQENTVSEPLSRTVEESEVSYSQDFNPSPVLAPEEKQPFPVSESEAIEPSLLSEKPQFSDEKKPEFLFNTPDTIELEPEQREVKLLENAAKKLIDLFDGQVVQMKQQAAPPTIIVEPETPPNYSYSSAVHEAEEFIDYGEPEEENLEDMPF